MSRRKAKWRKENRPIYDGAASGDLFLQTDPIGSKAGLNWYAYVGNDPLSRRDPTGLYDCKGNEDECKRFASDLSTLRRAKNVSGLSSADHNRLGGAIKAYGTKGDGNGVTVSFGALSGTPFAETAGGFRSKTQSITINCAKIDQRTKPGAGRDALSASVVGHEGKHVEDHISGYFEADYGYLQYFQKSEYSG
ncbi:RHS repeat-associated core domain-containing protein [Caulobacter sp. Root1455]|uniref:RHS repeat-associated core domain-containing protein n=1 Tax=Caulobacter sp. Root1455 TaxID=1736465 RepID=UPI0012E38525|nr:RHS repeat-associated core domain-containing protein [Caulobacter sp. Root1455]